jgi:polar amino acid transport system substrate-binding protein
MKTVRRSVLGVLAFGVLTAALGWSPAAEAQQQQSVLSDVLKRGVLRIATIGGNPPYSSLGTDGKPVGYDIRRAVPTSPSPTSPPTSSARR